MVKGLANEAMLRRLAENGYPVNFDALDAAFNLTITPVTSIDVDSQVLIEFSKNVEKQVRESEFSCKLADVVIFVVILNSEIKSKKDNSSWKKNSNAYVIRRSIDFFVWKNAKVSQKKKLLTECIFLSIEGISEKHLDDERKKALCKIVSQA